MTLVDRLILGNRNYIANGDSSLREDTAINGQHPYAIVICCSDSRVIPEQIFSASLGDLFVIRVAGNVLTTISLEVLSTLRPIWTAN